jgi:hypothetical protein
MPEGADCDADAPSRPRVDWLMSGGGGGRRSERRKCALRGGCWTAGESGSMGGKRGKGPIAKKGHKIRMERMVARAKIIAAGGGVMPEQSATEAGLVGVNNGDDTVEELTAALQEAFPSLDADLVQCLVASCTVDGALPPSVHIVRVGSCTRQRLSPPPLARRPQTPSLYRDFRPRS